MAHPEVFVLLAEGKLLRCITLPTGKEVWNLRPEHDVFRQLPIRATLLREDRHLLYIGGLTPPMLWMVSPAGYEQVPLPDVDIDARLAAPLNGIVGKTLVVLEQKRLPTGRYATPGLWWSDDLGHTWERHALPTHFVAADVVHYGDARYLVAGTEASSSAEPEHDRPVVYCLARKGLGDREALEENELRVPWRSRFREIGCRRVATDGHAVAAVTEPSIPEDIWNRVWLGDTRWRSSRTRTPVVAIRVSNGCAVFLTEDGELRELSVARSPFMRSRKIKSELAGAGLHIGQAAFLGGLLAGYALPHRAEGTRVFIWDGSQSSTWDPGEHYPAHEVRHVYWGNDL